MTADWRFYSLDAVTRTVRDELPLGDVRINERLKGAGGLNATIPRRHPKATRANLDTETTLIGAVRDETLMFIFTLQNATSAPGDETIQLDGVGLWDLLRHRTLRSAAGMTHGTWRASELAVRFTSVDQFRIVEDLLDHTQTMAGGDLGIAVVYDVLSGVTRDRTYKANASSVGELIEELADVEDGFDWALEPGGTIDQITLTLRLSYPERGRTTGYRFDADGGPTTEPDAGGGQTGSGNLLAWGLSESSVDQIVRFIAVGAGEGADQVVAVAEDPNLLGALPLREGRGAWTDITRRSTLTTHALRELALNSRASRIPLLLARPDAEPRLGSYILGDRVNVSIDDGWVQVDGTYRVIARTIQLGDDGAETVGLEVAEIERFA